MRVRVIGAARARGETFVDGLLLEEHAFGAGDAAAARETVAQGHLDGVLRTRGVCGRKRTRGFIGCGHDGRARGLTPTAGGDELTGGWSDGDVGASITLAALVSMPMVFSVGPLLDPHVAREVAASARIVVASSSMPIRDIEWYAPTGDGLLVYANRGANGIDGVMATAIGVASELGRVTALVGDVAFVHDLSSLALLASRGLDIRIVVTNNDGGAIFSYLPQAVSVKPVTFEKLFGTPHGTDIVAVASGFGLPVDVPRDVDALRIALTQPGPRVIVVETDRAEDHAVHGRLNSAIREAVDAVLSSGGDS